MVGDEEDMNGMFASLETIGSSGNIYGISWLCDGRKIGQRAFPRLVRRKTIAFLICNLDMIRKNMDMRVCHIIVSFCKLPFVSEYVGCSTEGAGMSEVESERR
jgi:hypothetical protein